jgi:hypothetical protein
MMRGKEIEFPFLDTGSMKAENCHNKVQILFCL